MTSSHIMWVPKQQRFMFNGISGSFESVKLPDEADTLRRDMYKFASTMGPVQRAAFRAGYVYRLGPFGEGLCRSLTDCEASGDDQHAGGAPDAMWPAPEGELALTETFELTVAKSEELTNLGVRCRKAGDLVGAKRFFLRCALAGTGMGNLSMLGIGLSNVATVYGDEKRFIRAFGYAISGAGSLNLAETDPTWPFFASLVNRFRAQLGTEMERRITDLVRIACSPWDFTWRVDDIERETVVCN